MTPRKPIVCPCAECRGREWPIGELRAHPAFYDLDDEGRVEAFEAARRLRVMEAALDADGLSTTARAVLARIRRG